PVPRDITVLMLRLKVHALGLGYSGVSPATFERLLRFDELDLVPVVPSRGSVGASGDLAPLAHLCLPLIGHGEFWDAAGENPRPASWRRRSTASPTTRSSSRTATSSVAATSTANRWPWRSTSPPSRWRSWAASPSGGFTYCWKGTTACRGC